MMSCGIILDGDGYHELLFLALGVIVLEWSIFLFATKHIMKRKSFLQTPMLILRHQVCDLQPRKSKVQRIYSKFSLLYFHEV
jgi:hypothetical protein